METHKKLLLGNKAWVADKLSVHPDYFTSHAKGQTPKFLWIGCSDSRVPAEDVTGAEAGELFVHRNVANLVVHTDLNVLSVLQYAVEVLQVHHVIVCGHYGCGGVQNAMTRQDFGLINKWLRHLKDVYRMHQRELESIEQREARADRLVELNVIEQINNLAETSVVQRAWRKHNLPLIHGWVYDLKSGYLKEMATLTPTSHMESIYRFDYGPKLPDETSH